MSNKQTPRSIQDQYQCEGYFGFGAGVSKARGGGFEYCSEHCPLRKQCWDKHRQRVKERFPDLAEQVDQTQGDSKALEKLIREIGTEPYAAVMMGNMEDGILVEQQGKPKDRGEMTIPISRFKA